ncbi:hypothetical protein E3N88_35191 [Mikania micrantha]|uniref:DUF4218 domain-containing protein n=1 Tax=Mikania micrantha TaxID=192012 RepID=A0A5N6M0R3_9ASTR|nr:hypothetical protein E3N88_35191 [Mikania micrantha]
MFNGKKETTGPPKRLNNNQILEQLNSLPNRVPGKHLSHGGIKRKRDASEFNWNKKSIFFELDYWSSLELKHNLDVMHVEKNVCESLLGTLLMNKKSKDTLNARKDLENLGIRKNLWLTKNNNKVYQPHAPYSFTPGDRERFCKFIRGVRLPDGFGSNFKNKVISNNSNIAGLKSHDDHILMQRLLPVGVRVGLPANVATAICDLCTFFQKICARSIDANDMANAHKEVVKILCNLELIYPSAFFDIMVHLILHLPEKAILGGPVYMRWMYPFERYMKKLKAYVRNKARPEGSIAEGYVADEALTFCSMYLEGMQTKFNRLDRNADADIPKRQLHVFSSQCRPISKKKIIGLCVDAKKALEWFVLNNCDEIQGHKSREWYVGNAWYDTKQYILPTQAKQVFYLQDPYRTSTNWRVVQDVHHRKLWYHPSMSVANEIDILHDTQSSDYNFIADSVCEVGILGNFVYAYFEILTQTRLNKQRIQNEARRLGDNSSSEISDEYDVMKHALGERRGHFRGVGRVVKSVPAEMSSSYSTQSQGWQQNWEQQMREQVQQEVQTQMNENLHKMQADFARQFEEMRQSFQQQKDSQNEEESESD